jgi:hypothetical protein
MENCIPLPHPDELRRRIDACEGELKALRKLLRASQDYYDAETNRRKRAEVLQALSIPRPAGEGPDAA